MWALYGLFWFLCLPATMFQQMQYRHHEFYDQLVTGISAEPGVMVAFCFSVLCAMALFSYLFQHRSAVAMHAFPLRRECLFFTNYVSGLAFFALPLAINFVLILLVELLAGQVNLGALLVWFTAQLCYALFFYSFAVFCAMFTGNLLALPAFYGILSFLPMVLSWFINEMVSLLVFGYASSYAMERAARTLSPAANLWAKVSAQSRELPGEVLYYISGWGWILLYAFVGVLLAVAALLVYRRRQVESAGDVVSVRVVRPLFLYGVSTCMALAFGLFLFALFGDSSSPTAAWQLLACMLIAGFLGYFAAQMLLNKTLRVFRGHWRGFAAFCAAVALVVTGMEFDLLGLERALPSAESVEFVEINGNFPPYDGRGSFFYAEPEAIRQVIDLNREIVEQRDAIQEELNTPYDGYSIEPIELGDGSDYYPTSRTVHLDLIYHRKDGSTLTRYYRIWLQETRLDDPDSVESRLQEVLNQPEQMEYYFDRHTEEQLAAADVMVNGEWQQVDGGQAGLLFQAVQRDMASGDIGRLWVLESREYREVQMNCCISFTFREANQNGDYRYYSYEISPTRNSASTLAALRSLGINPQTAY